MGASHAQRKRTDHFVPAGHPAVANGETSRASSYRPQEQSLLHDYEFPEPGAGRHEFLEWSRMGAGEDGWFESPRGYFCSRPWTGAGVAGGISQVKEP